MSFDISPTLRVSTYHTRGVKKFRYFTHIRNPIFRPMLSTFYTQSFDILHTLFRHFTHRLWNDSAILKIKSGTCGYPQNP